MNDNFNRRESENQLDDGLFDSDTFNEDHLNQSEVDGELKAPNETIDDDEEVHKDDKLVDINDSTRPATDDHESNEGDAINLNQDYEAASQLSDDQDESTIRNNDNFDNTNDSAYETNDINSQNGSNSRLQSADTNDEDIDTETGENFLVQTREKSEAEVVELMREDARIEEMENFEIEKFENDLADPPSPTQSDDDNDVVLIADNPIETGDSKTASRDGGLDGNEAARKEVHDFHLIT